MELVSVQRRTTLVVERLCVCLLKQGKRRSIVKMAIQKLDSLTTAWAELPEHVFEAVVEHLQRDRGVSAVLRRVCQAWREAHDR
jgi:hypothetical protein